jgi:hypothetical protein
LTMVLMILTDSFVLEHGLVSESGHVVESVLGLGHVECTGRVLHVVDAVTLVVC